MASGIEGLPELADYPAVAASLLARGVTARELDAPLADEDVGVAEREDGRWNRLATALMALFRDSGDREAFEALYALTRASVLAWIQGLLKRAGGGSDPFEVLQDTYVNVYRYPRSFREDHPGSFRVWVRTIAGNLVRRSGAPRGLSFQALPEGLQEPCDARGGPLFEVVEGDEERHLGQAWSLFLLLYAEAWKELSQRDRRTLHLIEVEGLSYHEAGRVLGVGRSNMKMIVFRARRRIARVIGRVLAAGRVAAAELEVA